MSHPQQHARGSLFELAVEALQNELQTRLAQLHSRKSEIGRLSGLQDFLTSLGWNARADVATHPHAGALLRLWINVGGQHELTELLADIGGQHIEIARQEFQDIGDTQGYELTLSERMKVLMRVGVAHRHPAKAAA
jgi:undecaprenyl pyrophosphate synthase